jgi:APA family basic amino acid/polyamine antiporter
VTLVVILALYYTVGPQLISSASYLNYFNPSQWKIPVVSFFALYANIAANNPAVAILISLAFIFGYMTVTGWSFIIFSRAVFALSFDRILPSSLADINEKYHTPIKAYIVFGILTVIFLMLLTFPSTAVTIYTYGVGLNVVYMISFFLTSISLMILPYRYRQLYESSCPVKTKVAGVPVVSVIGAISAIFLVLYEYIFITYNVYFGVTTNFLEVMVGFVVFFIVLYFVIIAYRKRQGVDVTLVYREIPPERMEEREGVRLINRESPCS